MSYSCQSILMSVDSPILIHSHAVAKFHSDLKPVTLHGSCRLEPPTQIMVDTNYIQSAFGPVAFIMEIPEVNLSIKHRQTHLKYSRISIQ